MLDSLSSEKLISFIPVLLPLTLALAGWCVVKLVQIMAVRPKKFVGFFNLLGWQGYLYRNQEWQRQTWSREFLEPLAGIPQIYEYLSPEKIVSHQLSHLRPQVDAIIDQIMGANNAVLWENLPVLIKNRFYAKTHKLLPRIIDDIVEDWVDNLGRTLGHRKLLHFSEQRKPGITEKLYHKLYHKSYERLANFAACLGFSLGMIQIFIASFFDTNQIMFWSLSAGFSCFFFFWLGKLWLLYPLKPLQWGPWTIASPFSKSRPELDAELARFLAYGLLTVSNITHSMIDGERNSHARSIIRKRVSTLVEDVNIRTFVQLAVGPKGYLELKNTLTERLIVAMLEPLQDETFNRARAKQVEGFLLQRLKQTGDPIFHRQLKLSLDPLSSIGGIGGFLIGALAGAIQYCLLIM